MGQSRKLLNPIGIGMILGTVIITVPSCIDEIYDLKNGISSDIVLGGDSLALPLGSTDTIRLSDFLNSDDIEMLKEMENGGYALTMKDSMMVDVPKIDSSTLKIANQTFSQKQTVSFGNISLEGVEIPGVSKTQDINLSMGSISLADFDVPNINSNESFSTKMYDYQITDVTIGDTTVNGTTENLLGDFILPADPGISVEVPVPDPLHPASPVSVNTTNELNYRITVPDGISGINVIDLVDDPKAFFEISIELIGAKDIFTAGSITPDLTINPSDLFVFTENLPGNNIHFGASDVMDGSSDFKAYRKLFIDSLRITDQPSDGLLNIAKTITAIGTMTADGLKIMSDNLNKVGDLDLRVSITIDGMQIASVEFDIPTIQTSIDGANNFTINSTLPSDIQKVNEEIFTNPGTISFDLGIQNLPQDMTNPAVIIDNLSITFPDEFVFAPNQEGLNGQTYTLPASESDFDLNAGKQISLNLEKLNLSDKELDSNNTLLWNDSITYSGQFSFTGRINSSKVPTTPETDTKMLMNVGSNLGFSSAEVVTNDIVKPLPATAVPISLDVDIADQVDSLSIINLEPDTKFIISFVKPTGFPENLKFESKGIQIVFPDVFQFNPALPTNTYTIPAGDLPESFELILAALNINEKLNEGNLTRNENIDVVGDVVLKSGTASSLDIQNLNNSIMQVKAETPDLKIASTDVKLKSLEADFSDTTKLEVKIEDLPAEIVSLDSIALTENANLQLAIKIKNLPTMSSPLNAHIKLSFPDLLKFVPGAVDADNELIINEPFVGDSLVKTIGISGLQFDGKNLNQELYINEDVGFDGRVSVDDPTVNSAELNNDPIDILVEVKLQGVKFKSVYGKVDPAIEPQQMKVKLGDLPSFMKGEDVVLDVTKPVISLKSSTNLGIPILAGMELTPIRNGAELTDNKQSISLKFPMSESPQVSKEANFWIGPNNAGMPDGYEWVNTEIQKLFKTIPDEISFVVNADVDPDPLIKHFIDLTADYKMKVNYEVTVPLAFGQDLMIEIKDTLRDLDPAVGEVALTGRKLELFGTILNSIPLDLTLTLTPMDENLTPIGDIVATQQILAGAKDGTAKSTDLTIELDDPNGLLKNVRNFELKFKAGSNSTVAGTPISPDNFIKADLKVRINGGISIGDI